MRVPLNPYTNPPMTADGALIPKSPIRYAMPRRDKRIWAYTVTVKATGLSKIRYNTLPGYRAWILRSAKYGEPENIYGFHSGKPPGYGINKYLFAGSLIKTLSQQKKHSTVNPHGAEEDKTTETQKHIDRKMAFG